MGGGGGGVGGSSNNNAHRDHLQQLQHSHFHHPFPSTHHPYAQLQQQQQQQQQQQHQERHQQHPHFEQPPQMPVHHHPQQHPQSAHHQNMGFLPSEHMSDPHQSAPTNLSVHHPGFPPPAQPPYFPVSPHHGQQFHHPGHAHFYQHQHHLPPSAGPQHSHPGQISIPELGAGLPQGLPNGGSTPSEGGSASAGLVNFAPDMHGNLPQNMHTSGPFAHEPPPETPSESGRARKKSGPKSAGRRSQPAATGSNQSANSTESNAPAQGPAPAPASGTPLVMHNANVPTRKQNQSCDNCRRRKIACRPPAPHVSNPNRRCAHCLNKDVDCTHNYVNRVQVAKLASELERPTSAKKAKNGDAQVANRTTGQLRQRSISSSAHPAGGRSSDEDEGSDADDDEELEGSEAGRDRLTRTGREESPATSVEAGPGHKRKRSHPDSVRRTKISRPLAGSAAPAHEPRLHPTSQLIRYLLCPSDTTLIHSSGTTYSSTSTSASASYFPTPLRLPISTASARRIATDAQLRSEVLHDFVESFLAIVNPRFALLDARRVRAGIYPFEELILNGKDNEQSANASETRFGKKTKRRRYRHAEEYLYRSDTDGEQDDGGLPSCAPASRQQRDQNLAPAARRNNGDGKSAELNVARIPPVPGSSQSRNLSSLRPRPLPDVLLAVVLAFGAKFSSHEILVADRAESAGYLSKAWEFCKSDAEAKRARSSDKSYGSSEDEDEDEDEDEEEGAAEYAMEPSIVCSGRSSIMKSLLIKAQDVLEKRRAFALPTLTNVQAALLMEPLFDQGVRLDEHKKGTPKWEVLAELLQQFDGEAGREDVGPTSADAPVSQWRPQSSAARNLDAKSMRQLVRTAAVLSARTRGSETSSSQPSLDFCGFWHSVALRHLLELRLHEADYVATLCDIDILTARRPDFFGESELERKLLEEELKASVDAERSKMDVEKGEGSGGGGGVSGGGSKAMVSYKVTALDAAIGATNSLGTLAQSAWWMASTSDAITSAFFRKRPLMRPEEMLGGQAQSEVESDGEETQANESAGAVNGANANAQEGGLTPTEAPRLNGGMGPTSSDSRAVARTSRSDSGEFNANRSRSQSLAQRSGRTSHESSSMSGTGAASRRRLRRLNTGGITREAGPDPYEGSDETGTTLLEDESSSGIQAPVLGNGRDMDSRFRSASIKSVSSSSIVAGAGLTNLDTELSSLSAAVMAEPPSSTSETRARANPEKLALLGERVSLPKTDSYQIWYSGISELCKIHRLMWDTLWSPRARAQGVRLDPLRNIQRRTEKWRRTYLPKLGVPYDRVDGGQEKLGGGGSGGSEVASWPQEWDFIAASTANMLSINSFALDILMWQAVEDHGIAEAREMESDTEVENDEEGGAGGAGGAALNSAATTTAGLNKARLAAIGEGSGSADSKKGRGGSLGPNLLPGAAGGDSIGGEELTPAACAERSVCNNALAASLRIAALVEVLRANYYLRLDPNILHFTIHAAGQFLVTYDNSAVYSIIEGLKQYGLSYEEGLEQADQLAAYASAAGIPRVPPSSSAASGGGGGMGIAGANVIPEEAEGEAEDHQDEMANAILAMSRPSAGQGQTNGFGAASSMEMQMPIVAAANGMNP
ncbi:hypothetical protein CF326_g3308 [Tilletia indica]|nr:hypothetical protein CF326_g3308 [Tilletia indica]